MNRWITAVGIVCVVAGASLAEQSVLGLGSTSPSSATDPAQKPAPKSTEADKSASADAAFIRQAAMDGMAEVEHGRTATQNASSAEVKQFGQRMVDDHSKANEELKGLASKKQVMLAAELDQKHRAMQEKLSKLKGAEFDRTYMSHMVMAHQEAVKLFQTEAKSGQDPDTKTWAEKTLPTLQEHLKLAREVNAKVGK